MSASFTSKMLDALVQIEILAHETQTRKKAQKMLEI